ncbi:hypothetical protein [Natronosalvus amylolyticus]|uniref:hypothetical protein n=1 Tax=Natronosalvus amylolyticus TaxID=2961994 RepID=UPI0020C94E7A|nr:hypothetical protein [Natronosalvus amylolyticus]
MRFSQIVPKWFARFERFTHTTRIARRYIETPLCLEVAAHRSLRSVQERAMGVGQWAEQ